MCAMPSKPVGKRIPSVEEYLEGERHSDIRHEYIDGEIYAMVGASDRHGLIVNDLAFALTPAVRRKRCQ